MIKKKDNNSTMVSENSKSAQDDFASEFVKPVDRTITFESADTNRIKAANMYGFGHR